MRVAIDRPGDGADYVNVKAFGKPAKSCQQYLGKGRRVSNRMSARLGWPRTERGGHETAPG
jgi:single-stranded DNA-binding protein